MKRSICLLICLILLFSSCTVPAVNTEGTQAGGETEEAFSDAESTEKEETTNNDEFTIDGVHYIRIRSCAELLELTCSEDLMQYDRLCLLLDGIVLEGDIVIPRGVDIVFESALRSNGYRLIIRTDDPGTVSISEKGAGAYIFLEQIYIDAPLCDVYSDSRMGTPDPGLVFCRNNIKSFNGEISPLGGTLDPVIHKIGLSGCEGVEYVIDASEIEVLIPYSVTDKEYKNASLYVDAEGEYSYIDEILTIENDGKYYKYAVNIRRISHSIPVLYIDTGDKEISSKEEYVQCTLVTDGTSVQGGIKGRGNASWNIFPKKGYRIKLDSSIPMLGMEKDKDWVLISAYPDQSLLRNAAALSMAKVLTNLEYTPECALCDVFINGEYVGIYTFAEKIELGSGKLDYNTDPDEYAFLLEVGWDFNDDMVYGKNFFDTGYIERIVIKEPDITVKYGDEVKYIMDYLKKTEKAIEALSGYEEYIDVDSLIDYMLALEFSCNTESAFYRSCYFYKLPGEKLKFGPVWDFDMAFGNHNMDNDDYDTLFTVDTPHPYLGKNGVTWFTLLWEDEAFRTRVKIRWNEVKQQLLSTALETIDHEYQRVYPSQIENFERWDILGKKVGESPKYCYSHNTYEKQVEYLKDFINERYKTLDSLLK